MYKDDSYKSLGVEFTSENGYGLYDPSYFPDLPPIKLDERYTMDIFRNITFKEMADVFDSLLLLIEEYKDYKCIIFDSTADDYYVDGILGDATFLLNNETEEEQRKDPLKGYPLMEIWSNWLAEYEDKILKLFKIKYCCRLINFHNDVSYDLIAYNAYTIDLIDKYFGIDDIKAFLDMALEKKRASLADSIISVLLSTAIGTEKLFDIYHGFLSSLFLSVPEEGWKRHIYDEDRRRSNLYRSLSEEDRQKFDEEVARLSVKPEMPPKLSLFEKSVLTHTKLVFTREVDFFIRGLWLSTTDEQHIKGLALQYAIGEVYDARYFLANIKHIALAVTKGLIDMGELRRAIIESHGFFIRSVLDEEVTTFENKPLDVLLECTEVVLSRMLQIIFKSGI